MELALNVAGEANKAVLLAVVVEYERRIGESPLVRTEDIECGGVGCGGVPLAVAGPGAVVVGCNSGAAWSSSLLAAANDKCLPFCCGDRDDIGKGDKTLDRTVLC